MTHGVSGKTQPAELDLQTAREVAETMQALATPSRLRILGRLRSGPCSVGELGEAIGMEQSAVSHQLRVLREHRIVSVERIGRRRRYALHDEDVAVLVDAALHHVSGGRAVRRADVG